MAIVRLSCQGFQVRRLWVPSFQVSEGEFVCMHLPPECTAEEQEELMEKLSSGRNAPGLSFLGTATLADRARAKRGFLWLARNPAIVDWLTQSDGVTRDQALEILKRWNEPPGRKIGVMQWNPRTLIGLDAAFRRGANIVVFDTSGNDASTIQAAYDLVASNLSSHAVIYISHHYEADRICFAGARCVKLDLETTPNTERTPTVSAAHSARS